MTQLEDSLAASYETKHTIIIQSSNCALRYLPKGAENKLMHSEPSESPLQDPVIYTYTKI